jgi:glutathione S-transferase
MKVTVYGGSHYDRSGKIRWLLEELGVKHDDHWLDSEKGDLESESYLKWMYFAVSLDSFASRISIIEDIPAGDVLDQKMGAYITEVKDYVAFLGASLEKRDYLTGEFSTADICVGVPPLHR